MVKGQTTYDNYGKYGFLPKYCYSAFETLAHGSLTCRAVSLSSSDSVKCHRPFVSVACIHSLVAVFHTPLRPYGQRQVRVRAGLFPQVAHQAVE